MTGLLDAEDVHSTRKAVEALGATVRAEGAEVVVVPPERLREPGDVIDCGNSGTSLRLLTGVLSGVPASRCSPATPRCAAARSAASSSRSARMGANLSARDGDRLPPVVVRGGPLRGARHVLEVASAQVKSACLLAGLFAEGETSVTEPERSRDHTERMLRGMGVPVRTDGLDVTVGPRAAARRPRGRARRHLLGGLLPLRRRGGPGSEVTVRGLGVNPTRTGLLDVLARWAPASPSRTSARSRASRAPT